MTTVAKNALEVFDPAKLKISHSDYSGKSTAEARKAIRVLLEDYNVVIATEAIDQSKITPYLQGTAFPSYIQSYGQMEGIGMVRAYYDGSANTGAIKNGHPVVLDTVVGNAVTGIHSTWKSDEYKIIGVALADYTDTGQGKRIPVRLQPPVPAVSFQLPPEAIQIGGPVAVPLSGAGVNVTLGNAHSVVSTDWANSWVYMDGSTMKFRRSGTYVCQLDGDFFCDGWTPTNMTLLETSNLFSPDPNINVGWVERIPTNVGIQTSFNLNLLDSGGSLLTYEGSQSMIMLAYLHLQALGSPRYAFTPVHCTVRRVFTIPDSQTPFSFSVTAFASRVLNTTPNPPDASIGRVFLSVRPVTNRDWTTNPFF